ncbi:MAG: bifunctional hydroxymethylpyrimidine kinase/phosphomethylpyrimidine kinase [Clostridiales Family XIII bacterium]|jgi:hydroxymethylpyrimidine/phosphomethylpyrimidine kinase|nr:bifunctional hydroxymethylpyrimidine kinase/phosphomethylpyrimidine kinase [Clostridiales Family XIII bacterium]
MKTVLSVAGSDCSGGAGIQADLKTFSAHGVFGMNVIISVVAENTSRVIDFQDISGDIIGKQFDAVFEDIHVDAVKIGMLSSAGCMEAVHNKLIEYRPSNIVIDPVMCAKNGSPLMDPSAVGCLIELIVPFADVLTPNIPEAEKLADMSITSLKDMEQAAACIFRMGCRNVLLKGGHFKGNAVDILFDGNSYHHFVAPRIDTKNTHGTGCTYSSAIASNLALGFETVPAISRAKVYMNMVIEHSLDIGHGNGPTNHFYDLYKNGLKD